MMRGREYFTGGLAVAEEAFALAQRGGHVDSAFAVARGLCFAYVADGRLELARRIIDWVIAEGGKRNPDPTNPTDFELSARWVRVVVDYGSEDFDRARRTGGEVYAAAARRNNRTVQCITASTLAQLEFLVGRYDDARRWAERSFELAQEIGNVAAFAASATIAVAARMRLGETFDLAVYLDAIEHGLAVSGPAQINFRFLSEAVVHSPDLDLAERLARLTYERGGGRLRQALGATALADVLQRRGGPQLLEAERLYREAVSLAGALGLHSVAVPAWIGLAELAARRDEIDATAIGHARDAVAALGLGHYVDRLRRLAPVAAVTQPSA
jgi:hypothetical protein